MATAIPERVLEKIIKNLRPQKKRSLKNRKSFRASLTPNEANPSGVVLCRYVMARG